MKKDHQEPLEQLNNEAPVAEAVQTEVSYDLEDIIKEFGGWTKAKPAPKPEPAEEPKQDTEVMRVAAVKAAEEARRDIPADLTGDTIRFSPVEEDVPEDEQPEPGTAVEMPAEPEPDKEQLRQARRAQRRSEYRLRKQEAQRRKAQKAALRAARREEPETVYPSAEEACADYARAGSLRLRMIVSAVLCAVSAVLLFLGDGPVLGLELTGNLRVFSVTMLALLLAQCVMSYEIFVRGIYHALKMQFDLGSMMTLTVLICLADGFFAVSQERVPFCTAPAFLLLIAMWGLRLEKKAKLRTLRTVLSMEHPVAAVKEEKAWHGLDCIFRAAGSLDDFTAMLETPDAAKKVMRVYAPMAAVLSFVLAGFSSVRGQAEFLWAWSALLTAALPAGGFIACCRPFSILAKRLQQDGAAICGWRGAKILSGECGIVIGDADLFPKANISMNGMKMYSELPTRQVVGYATAVIQAAGSGLLPLFEEVMKNEDGRRYKADSFRQYEGGGLGAEIKGDVVLLGSLAFMRLMGVHVPEGTRVQSALYISINKELVGVFALTYQPSPGTRSGLGRVLRSAGLTPILGTRDFMITPALVKKRYKISVDRLEFPVVAERISLSEEDAGEGGSQGALMGKDSFLSFAAAVTGGRLLRRAVHSAVAISVFCGLLGLGLMGVLTYLGSTMALSAANLLLFHLIWAVPTLFITGLIGES